MGMLRTFAGGEVKEYSDMYNHTRHLALERLEAEAAQRGANAVVDITTRILPFGPGVPRDVDGGHGLTLSGLGPSRQAGYVGAYRRGALEPDQPRLSADTADAGLVGLRPGFWRRSSRHSSVRLPAAR